MIQTLKIPNRLSKNPEHSLLFSKKISLKDGTSISVADPDATRAMVALMDMDAVIGGAASHYGGPAAFAEMNSALYGIVFHKANQSGTQWFDLFNIVNDAGHCENGVYALKANYQTAGLKIEDLRKFRSIESNLTGHGEAHCFPEGVLLSNGPLGSAVPQAQGLAMGDSLAGRSRVTIVTVSDGACMEGEVKEAFASIPGMAIKGQLAPFVLMISDNNTKLSGRIDKDSFSMKPTFESLKMLGWDVIEVEKGNDLQIVAHAIEEAIVRSQKNATKPVALVMKTTKGIGTKKTAESSTGAHGFPCKSASEIEAFVSEIYSGSEVPQIFQQWAKALVMREAEVKAKSVPDQGEKIQKGVAAAMIKAKKMGLPLVSISSDLPGSTGVADFRKEFPESSIDVGIAESNMVSVAAGMSKVGFIPVVDTFAQFGVTKGALPHTMASLSFAPMIAVYSHSGFQDAADGASHQALSYLAMLSSIPEIDTYCLTCSEEAESLMLQAFEQFAKAQEKGVTPRTSVFFLGRENFPKTYAEGMKYQLGSGQILRDTSTGKQKSVTIAVSGSLVPEALKAVKKLEEQGIGTILVNPSQMNKVSDQVIQAVQKTNGCLLTVEDHQVIGGMGQFLTHQLAEQGILKRVKSLGVRGEFGQSAYTALELYSKHGLDSQAIQKAADVLIG